MSSPSFKENDLVSADIFNNDLTLNKNVVNDMKKKRKKRSFTFCIC
jgi:hypothetical protein